MNLSVGYITARHDPKIEWFLDSLRLQAKPEYEIEVIIVDALKDKRALNVPVECRHESPKPNIWGGAHRLTKDEWWHVSAARNTALCLCKSDYIVWVDDRCVLGPQWVRALRDALHGGYAVCGNYEKRHSMRVEEGNIVDFGKLDGKDERDNGSGIRKCYGQFWGGTYGMPTEWALKVNGWEELVDGLGAEDYLLGHMLINNGFLTQYDPKLKIIEDRTPGECGPTMRKTDKGVSPNDKSHAALERFGSLKASAHPWNLRAIRESVLSGGVWPSVDEFPKIDWYDQMPIKEFDAL